MFRPDLNQTHLLMRIHFWNRYPDPRPWPQHTFFVPKSALIVLNFPPYFPIWGLPIELFGFKIRIQSYWTSKKCRCTYIYTRLLGQTVQRFGIMVIILIINIKGVQKNKRLTFSLIPSFNCDIYWRPSLGSGKLTQHREIRI